MNDPEHAPDTLTPDSRVAGRFSMTGRRALVTGGSVSIGRAIAIALAEAGADIALHYARAADDAGGLPSAAAERAAAGTALGRRAALVEADFETRGAAGQALREASEALGGIDILVVCASIQYRTAFEAITPEQVERQWRINFAATVELMQAAMPPMRERGWGRVLTIGSINETRPEIELAVYAALKSAQHNLAINLARQYAAHGVTVNNLSPGLIATERNRWRRLNQDSWTDIQRRANPMGRAGTPDEIAGGALLLCSEAGRFITGADLQIDGGHHL